MELSPSPCSRSMSPKLRKAARGKHRWLGVRFSKLITGREIFCSQLEEYLENKIFFETLDFEKNAPHTCIIKVSLADYSAIRVALESHDNTRFVSLTASGKLRLVRERLRESY